MADTPTADLVVAGELPPAPYMLANQGFMSTLAARERKILELEITDAAGAQAAADLQRLITDDGIALEADREGLVAPLVAFQRKINAAAKPVLGRIETAKARLSAKLAGWANKEKERQAQIERDRLAELQRLRVKAEEETRQAAATAQRVLDATRARETAAAAPMSPAPAQPASPVVRRILVVDAPAPAPLAPAVRRLIVLGAPPPAPPKTETQVAIERLQHAPAPAAAAMPVGVKFVTTLDFEVLDVAVLPEPFVIRKADEKKIREQFCVGHVKGSPLPELAGVRFTENTRSVST